MLREGRILQHSGYYLVMVVFVSAGGSTVRLVKNDQEDNGTINEVKDIDEKAVETG